MRALATFLVTLIFVGAIGYAGLLYVRENADKFKANSLPGKLGQELKPPQPTGPPPRGPIDYHVLQDQGGEPLANAELAGLVTERWAYLSSLTPVQISPGVAAASGLAVRQRNYDLGFRFTPEGAEEQYLEYTLGGSWDELHFGFGFLDTEPSDPNGSFAIEFRVLVDGLPAFGPQRLTPVDKPVFTRLRVKGCNRVVFVSKRIGVGNGMSPVLLDPFLRMADPPSAAAAEAPGAVK